VTQYNVTGKTKICALIGDPVEHTMSPAMQNAAFRELGLDYLYIPFRVRAKDLPNAIYGMRALNIAGFNITIPHKVAAIPLLDGLDPLAEKIGAVNTVLNIDGELRGYNTDATGFLRALREQDVETTGKNVVVIGAGGAARAITYILAENRAYLTVLNRAQEIDWAEVLAQLLLDDFGREVRVLELNSDNLKSALENADILVNATSVGMSPAGGETPVPAFIIRPDLVVFDVVYNPIQTRLLKEAGEAGAKLISGIDMLAWQGALAFERWTGKEAPVELMRDEAVKILEKNED
jgi:shikimate dehydrogenase